MLSREKIILRIFKKHKNSFYIISTGYLSRAVYNLFPDKKNIFYMQGSMGLSPAIGLGLAYNVDKNVVVLTGDAALLMHLGVTHTIRDYNLKNLYVYVLDNGCHESVGEQKCSPLEEKYPGIEMIYKINREGKRSRVGKNWIKIKKDFIKVINDK